MNGKYQSINRKKVATRVYFFLPMKLSEQQIKILKLAQQGCTFIQYIDHYTYRLPESRLYRKVNKATVESLIKADYLKRNFDFTLSLTDKGINYKVIQ